MAGILEGFNQGFSAGSNIRKRWDTEANRARMQELQERQFQAMERHRRWSEGKQQEQLDLQKRSADNVLMQQLHGVLNNPQLHPEAKSFMVDDIARQRGHDPKGEYYQGFKKMLLKMPIDQARALTGGLIKVFPELQPGAVGEIVDGLFTGGIQPTQIPGLMKDLQARVEAMEAKRADAGIFKQPNAGEPAQSGALPTDTFAQNPAVEDVSPDTFAQNPMFTDTFSEAGAADFSSPEMGIEPMAGGGGDELAAMASQSGASLMQPSAATPAMTGQIDQMQGVMDDQGGTPPGTSPGTLGELFGVTKPAQAAKPVPVAPTAPAAASVAETPSVPPEQTSQYWLGEAARLDALAEQAVRGGGSGENFRKSADNAREQAQALSQIGERTAKLPRDPKKQAAGIASMLQDAMDAPMEFGKRATERALGPWQASVADTGTVGSAVGAVVNFLPQWIARTGAEIDAMVEGGAAPTEVRDRIEAKNDRIAMVMKAFVRLPGEGVWSDKDQAFLTKLLSGASRSRDVDEYGRRMGDIKDYIEHTLGFDLPMPGPRASGSGPGPLGAPEDFTPWRPITKGINRAGESAANWFTEEVRRGRQNVPPMIRRNQPTR